MSEFPFDPSTLSGSSTFQHGIFGISDSCPSFFCGTPFGLVNFANVIPPNPIDILIPPNPVFPGETLLWQLGGLLHFGQPDFATCAYPVSAIPTDPCIPSGPPIIPIATLASAAFAPFTVSGPVFAFDDAVQVGTWQIRGSPAAIPEPATLWLFGLALAGLAVARRDRATVRTPS